jgi:hypothetical protein
MQPAPEGLRPAARRALEALLYTSSTQPRSLKTLSRNAELKARARFMRRNPTASEHLLWRCCLSGKRLLGVQFRRQVPLLGCYIVDFLAPKLKLVVEIDGGYHDSRLHLDFSPPIAPRDHAQFAFGSPGRRPVRGA